jgi:uncharacterized protein
MSFLSLLALGVALAQDVAVPNLSGHVNDLTSTLSASQAGTLEAQLAAFEKSKGTQVVVLLVPTTKPEAIEEYSMRVAEAWKIGRKSVDDGVILVVAKQDRKLRIEVGYGLEGALPDATAKHIVDEVISPHFRTGQFYEGLTAGTDAIMKAVSGEALPAPIGKDWQAGRDQGWPQYLVVGFFVLTGLGLWLRSFIGRLPAALVTGGITVLLLKMFVTGLLLAGAGGLVIFVLTLLGGLAGGGRWSGTSGRGGWGGGGGGFSGGGGFGGGGGGFGGGGASGKW